MAITDVREDASRLKNEVREFWDRGGCGEVYAQGSSLLEMMEAQAAARYSLEPYIPEFARFSEAAGGDVLEVGVGMGADHLEWARAAPRSLTGVDLTARAVACTRSRLELYGFTSSLIVADAEQLPFNEDSFDIVYSWGVLHHTPDTQRAISEVRRILRPGGTARVMIYHKYSIVGYMLWARYALMGGHPGWGLADIYSRYLESPGTKAYSIQTARKLFSAFSQVDLHLRLSGGDLLQGGAGQRHAGTTLSLARRLWPRWLIRRVLVRHGLFLLIEAVK
jgi:SAM-dependent methyltransferase